MHLSRFSENLIQKRETIVKKKYVRILMLMKTIIVYTNAYLLLAMNQFMDQCLWSWEKLTQYVTKNLANVQRKKGICDILSIY